MTHYEKVSTDLVKIKNHIAPNNWQSYTEVHFSEDWISRKEMDWKAYLIRLLDVVQDLKNQHQSTLDQKYKEGDGFFDRLWGAPEFPAEFFLKYHGEESYIVQSHEEKTNLEEWDFSRHHIKHVKDLEMDLQKCFAFFEENKNSPPYSEKIMSVDKIPFWGNQSEFTFILGLLIESEFFPVKKPASRQHPKKILIETERGFENYISSNKSKMIELFCKYIKGGTIETTKDDQGKNQEIIQFHSFNHKTVFAKMSDSYLSQLDTDSIIDIERKLILLREKFDEIKNSKITDKQSLKSISEKSPK